MIVDTIEYSVCQDCVMAIAYGEPDEDFSHDVDAAIKRELGDRKGRFVVGVTPTEDDPDGLGNEEFSAHECELCRNGLAGSRHGVTMMLEGPEPATVTRRVLWEIDVEFAADADDRHIAESVAKAYFQDRIASGEPDTACVFKVMREDESGMWTGTTQDLSK